MTATEQHLLKLLTASLHAADWQLQGALKDHASWKRIVAVCTLLVPLTALANWALLRVAWLEFALATGSAYVFVVGVYLSFRWLVGRRIRELWKCVADLERAGHIVYRQRATGLYDYGLRVAASLPADAGDCVPLASHRLPSVAELTSGEARGR